MFASQSFRGFRVQCLEFRGLGFSVSGSKEFGDAGFGASGS